MTKMEYKQCDFEVKGFGEQPGTFEGLASVYGTKDLQGEVIDAGAFDKATDAIILWAHYTSEVLGSTTHVKEQGNALSIGGELDLEVQRAREAYSLLKNKHVKGLSVGFITIKDAWENGVRHIQEAILKEVSITAFPANPQALVQDVKDEFKAGRILSTASVAKIRAALDALTALLAEAEAPKSRPPEEIKGVIPYKKTPLADPATTWDGPGEVAAATPDDLKLMCAWVDDKGDPTTKAPYKLPHHLASGNHACVWNGVRAALGALGGSRGTPVQIPQVDIAGVRAHLEKHRADFGKSEDIDEHELKAYKEFLEATFAKTRASIDDATKN